jgi:thiamine-phosphate pyrophosphorylase
MELALISPEADEPRERRVLKALFSAGLSRYHVRRPGWDTFKLRRWLMAAPATWRRHLVLHGDPELAAEYQLAGVHYPAREAPLTPAPTPRPSRACHSLEELDVALGRYEAVLLSPIFPSISKPGHGPTEALSLEAITRRLARRTSDERRTRVYALGGVTPERLEACARAGFEGAAVLGAVWEAADPLQAFAAIRQAAERHAA